jgi:hypothetical protein
MNCQRYFAFNDKMLTLICRERVQRAHQDHYLKAECDEWVSVSV